MEEDGGIQEETSELTFRTTVDGVPGWKMDQLVPAYSYTGHALAENVALPYSGAIAGRFGGKYTSERESEPFRTHRGSSNRLVSREVISPS